MKLVEFIKKFTPDTYLVRYEGTSHNGVLYSHKDVIRIGEDNMVMFFDAFILELRDVEITHAIPIDNVYIGEYEL